ncbi:sulfotransferase [Lactiplantibacillus plantarum]|uniref:sulfotransferase n=1 Tax=Lactiplantibacillus plantarum TaxID=1590 RepID=UPI003F52DE52
MIISTIGYGATGSGAVYALLKEFSSIQDKSEVEFKLAYQVDGLEDLELHLMKRHAKNASGDAAIKRFKTLIDYYSRVPLTKKLVDPSSFKSISNEYLDGLIQASFKGLESIDTETGSVGKMIIAMAFKKKFIPLFQKITKNPYNFWPIRDIYVSVLPENFLDKTKAYVNKLLEAAGFDLNGNILLNQAFEANDPEASMKFFENSKAIVLDRDPRDLYIQHQIMTSGEGRWLPSRNVEAFVEQFKSIRSGQIKVNSENVMFVQFEDLIFNYEKECNKIIEFCALEKKDHVFKGEKFNPYKSINNTNLIEVYPQFKNDIVYIEKELPEFLYDFKNTDTTIKRNGNPFNA